MDEQDKKLPELKNKSSRELVEEEFINLGFMHENPDDLDLVTELLEIWRNPDIDDSSYPYTPEQHILLNDPDVITVLNKCKEYYEPKKHLSSGDLRTLLEKIATGDCNRKDYDFKNHTYVTVEPTFTDRIQAIKLLQNNIDDTDSGAIIQFVNNITQPQSQPQSQFPQPKMEAPEAPPPGHYSLTLLEGDT